MIIPSVVYNLNREVIAQIYAESQTMSARVVPFEVAQGVQAMEKCFADESTIIIGEYAFQIMAVRECSGKPKSGFLIRL